MCTRGATRGRDVPHQGSATIAQAHKVLFSLKLLHSGMEWRLRTDLRVSALLAISRSPAVARERRYGRGKEELKTD